MPARRSKHPLLEEASGRHVEEYQVEPGDVEFAASPLEWAGRLRRIHDNARTSVEEPGVTTLHLTCGALSWQDAWLGESLSPIWMVPAQLVSKGPSAPLRVVLADEEMQLNPALKIYLRERHKTILDRDNSDGKSMLRRFYAGKRMAPQVGLEPTTLRLTAGCSAIELLRSVVAAEEPSTASKIHEHHIKAIRHRKAVRSAGELASSILCNDLPEFAIIELRARPAIR